MPHAWPRGLSHGAPCVWSPAVVLLASTQGCYHYQVSVAGPSGGEPEHLLPSTTLHACSGGWLQDQALEHVCTQDEALARVRTTSNFGYTLLTVVTLGLWAPVQVEYACANPTPATGTIGGVHAAKDFAMPPTPRITSTGPQEWVNAHGNVTAPVTQLVDLRNPLTPGISRLSRPTTP